MNIGKYTVIRKLGKGGMGAVYKVCLPGEEQFLALKILDPFEIMLEIIGLPSLKKSFEAEAELMMRLQPSAVVRILDCGEDNRGRPYFVMDHFCKNPGEVLGEGFWMDKVSRIIPPAVALSFGRQLLTVLKHLHSKGVVHRDVKPFNLLLGSENRLRICDFGMALDGGTSLLEDSNMVIGSPFYAAPEQNSQSGDVDGRADLYSVAVILYRMLTGVFPDKEKVSLFLANPILEKKWKEFFHRALQRKPHKRFQDCSQMLLQLDALQQQCNDEVVDNWPGFMVDTTPLRSASKNIVGKDANRILGLSEQGQLLYFHDTSLLPSPDGNIITDTAHKLQWYQGPGGKMCSTTEARLFLDQLNQDISASESLWRMPTINELLSLLRPGRANLLAHCFLQKMLCLWSGDHYGNMDDWYLDCSMGIASHQDRSCENYVLPVRSF